MKSGTLRHRVRIERPVQTQDPNSGAMIKIWILYGERWADYEGKRIREFNAAGAPQNELAGWFKVRYDAGIQDTMRIIHRGKVHSILGIIPDPDSGLEHLRIEVSEGVISV